MPHLELHLTLEVTLEQLRQIISLLEKSNTPQKTSTKTSTRKPKRTRSESQAPSEQPQPEERPQPTEKQQELFRKFLLFYPKRLWSRITNEFQQNPGDTLERMRKQMDTWKELVTKDAPLETKTYSFKFKLDCIEEKTTLLDGWLRGDPSAQQIYMQRFKTRFTQAKDWDCETFSDVYTKIISTPNLQTTRIVARINKVLDILIKEAEEELKGGE